MKTQHTPGPWEFERHPDESRYFGNIIGFYSRYETNPSVGNSIRTITIQLKHGTESENIANAKLIAAAPELLDALRDLQCMYCDLLLSADQSVDLQKDNGYILSQSAIKKATE